LISFGFFGFPSIRYPSAICLLPTNLPTMWAVDDVNLLPATIAGLGTSLGGSSLESCCGWAPTSLKDTHSMSFHLIISFISLTSFHVMSCHFMSFHVVSFISLFLFISFITSFILFMSFQFVWLACPFNSLTRSPIWGAGFLLPEVRSHSCPTSQCRLQNHKCYIPLCWTPWQEGNYKVGAYGTSCFRLTMSISLVSWGRSIELQLQIPSRKRNYIIPMPFAEQFWCPSRGEFLLPRLITRGCSAYQENHGGVREVSMASLHLYISHKNPCVDTLFGEKHGKNQPSGCSRRCEPLARTKSPASVWVQGFDSAPKKRPPSQNVS